METKEPVASGAADWSLTTWEGARREQLRRWRELPLERMVAALEEMAEIDARLNPHRARRRPPKDAVADT